MPLCEGLYKHRPEHNHWYRCNCRQKGSCYQRTGWCISHGSWDQAFFTILPEKPSQVFIMVIKISQAFSLSQVSALCYSKRLLSQNSMSFPGANSFPLGLATNFRRAAWKTRHESGSTDYQRRSHAFWHAVNTRRILTRQPKAPANPPLCTFYSQCPSASSARNDFGLSRLQPRLLTSQRQQRCELRHHRQCPHGSWWQRRGRGSGPQAPALPWCPRRDHHLWGSAGTHPMLPGRRPGRCLLPSSPQPRLTPQTSQPKHQQLQPGPKPEQGVGSGGHGWKPWISSLLKFKKLELPAIRGSADEAELSPPWARRVRLFCPRGRWPDDGKPQPRHRGAAPRAEHRSARHLRPAPGSPPGLPAPSALRPPPRARRAAPRSLRRGGRRAPRSAACSCGSLSPLARRRDDKPPRRVPVPSLRTALRPHLRGGLCRRGE